MLQKCIDRFFFPRRVFLCDLMEFPLYMFLNLLLDFPLTFDVTRGIHEFIRTIGCANVDLD